MTAFSDTIEHWVSEFLVSTAGERTAAQMGERAGPILVAFMRGACGGALPPADLEQRNVLDGITIGLGPLELTTAEREATPELLEGFLAQMEESGRLGGGGALGVYARHAATAHLLKKRVRRRTIKVGPNDPCPCGSGRKYKKCCRNA